MNELAITIIGRDRPGIVAEVSGILAGLQLNLTDSTMTLLRGHFAMMLICVGEAPEPTAAAVEAALGPLTADGDLVAMVRAVPAITSLIPGTPFTLLVHGSDRLGIVAAVTGALARVGGNVTNLTTRLSGTLYLLSAEVDLPSAANADELMAELDTIAKSFGVELSLRSAEAEML